MKAEYADVYDAFEQRHWWFRARRVILRQLLAREVPWQTGMNVLEVGVGPGANLYTLYPPGLRLQGLDPDPVNSERARHRGPLPVYTGTVENMPEELGRDRFDAICLFDVLEHIEHDGAALDLLRQRLKPKGYLVLSVPTYQWMWGRQDVANMHYRRYTRTRLVRLLQQHGFRVQRATYFNTFLFPLIAAKRLLAKLQPLDLKGTESDFKFGNPLVDALLYGIFRAEAFFLRVLNFPCGVSLACVAQAPEVAQDGR